MTSGFSLSSGVASTWANFARRPFTFTAETSRSWKSRLSSRSFWVARAVIVVLVPAPNAFVSGS